MRRTVLCCSFFFVCFFLSAQNYWQKTNLAGKRIKKENASITVDELYSVDLTSLRNQLKSAPDRSSGKAPLVVYMPTTKGKVERFSVYSAPVMEKSMEDQYDLHSYVGTGIDDNKKYIRFNTSPTQFNSMIIDEKGKLQFIDPYTEDKSVYSVRERAYTEMEKFKCNTLDSLGINASQSGAVQKTLSSDQKFRTYRLALSTTGEYTRIFGGVAGALTQMNTTMTRVNGIFEKEFAINLIIQNFPDIIYTDPNTDPYSNSDSMSNWNMQLQRTLTQVVGEGNYDIGHLFGASGGGGSAGCIGCVCMSPPLNGGGVPTNVGKGSGITSPSTANQPFGDDFDVDFVAHEIGHQLGANHTFSFKLEGTGVNMEPGSGSTIMGYAGITGTPDIQAHSDDYFHSFSINQISTNLQSKSCGTSTPVANNPPVVVVGDPQIKIPVGAGFYLDAQGTTDPDGDALSYCWEQVDNATAKTRYVDPTQSSGPNFRSIDPTTETRRYFPKLGSSMTSLPNWETVSNVARTLNFRVTVRDNNANKPQTSYANKAVIYTTEYSPDLFKVTYPASTSSIGKGKTIDVKWNLAKTNEVPFNIQTAKLSLVLDDNETPSITSQLIQENKAQVVDGKIFIKLLETTPNSGQATVTLPDGVTSKKARILLEAIGGVIYTTSDDFLIGYETASTCNSYAYTGAVKSIPDGGNGAGTLPGASVGLALDVPAIQGTITDVNVTVNIDHPDISDLFIALRSPAGKQIQLWDTDCYTTPLSAGMNATFDDSGVRRTCSSPISGTIKSGDRLSLFNGGNATGQWVVVARDYYQGSTGTLNSFSLNICTSTVKELSLGVNNVEANESSFKVYPNPSDGKFQISLGNEMVKGKVSVKVYSMAGALVLQNQEVNSEFSVDLTKYPSGVYILNLEVNGKKLTKKLIKN